MIDVFFFFLHRMGSYAAAMITIALVTILGNNVRDLAYWTCRGIRHLLHRKQRYQRSLRRCRRLIIVDFLRLTDLRTIRVLLKSIVVTTVQFRVLVFITVRKVDRAMSKLWYVVSPHLRVFTLGQRSDRPTEAERLENL